MSKDINPELTQKIAKLARLSLSEAEVAAYTKDLDKIIDFVDQLREVNVDGVEPIVHAIDLESRLREDQETKISEDLAAEILNCSEDSLNKQYKVPQVISGE